MDEGWTPTAKVYDPLKAGSIDGTDTEPHDRAIIRAVMAKYKRPKYISGIAENTLFIGHLHPNTNEDTLMHNVSPHGDIERLTIVRDIVTGFSKCYAFVEYADEKTARLAYHALNRMEIDANEIFVEHEHSRLLPGWVPRRLGGGQGGRKESGQLRFGGRKRVFRKPFNLEKESEKLEIQRKYDSDGRWDNRERGDSKSSYRSMDYRDREFDRRRNRSRSRDRQRDDRHKRSRRERTRSRSRSESRNNDYSRRKHSRKSRSRSSEHKHKKSKKHKHKHKKEKYQSPKKEREHSPE